MSVERERERKSVCVGVFQIEVDYNYSSNSNFNTVYFTLFRIKEPNDLELKQKYYLKKFYLNKISNMKNWLYKLGLWIDEVGGEQDFLGDLLLAFILGPVLNFISLKILIFPWPNLSIYDDYLQ